MCEVYENIDLKLSVFQSGRYDPTHTTTLRNRMVAESNRRFDELIKVIRKAVVEEDCLALKSAPHTLLETPGERAFDFTIGERKVREFLRWLDEQVKKGLLVWEDLEDIGQSVYPAWTNKFVRQAYERGVSRARSELGKLGYIAPTVAGIEAIGGISFDMGVMHVERMGLLFSRVYSELRGITEQMEQQIGRVLAQGLLDGDNPRTIARKLVAAINGTGAGDLGLKDTLGRFIPARRRAEIMARTEIIRAHHLGSIQEYRNWGVAGVKIIAEWVTAGDERVCPECASLEGRRFTLDEIEGMIPLHPQCRCCAIPVTKQMIEKGI
jgi:SPP1 gp7 family putative phage head morphogenesis protein